LNAVGPHVLLREGRRHAEGESFGGLQWELERFEERLEKLMRGMDRVRNEIRKTKLMITIGFTAIIAFQILLRWIRF
jgi:hypothetical protein